MTVLSGIDAASLSDSSIGSEVLESLPSSPDGLGHDPLQNGRGMMMPATDRVVVDTIQATAEMTGLEDEMMFHINLGTPQDGDQNDIRWQTRPACNWNIRMWSSSPMPASHLKKIKDLHGRADTQVSRGAMIPGHESKRMRSSTDRRSSHLSLD